MGLRARLDANPTLRVLWRVGVAVIGGAVVITGLILVPYPGPGWLIVFGGLAILATEFEWARRLLHYARGYYDRWTAWLGRQSWPIKLLVLAGTCLVVLLMLWLLNALNMVAGWIGLDWTWLRSPFF
ncbi:MAG TPA: TIGR02611 family protein [Pseudonocardia sp.]|jgi:uncharacterized protein (TIGR02611 family)|uniref:TIGR02611 family protein n=1 Tax=Pseudonocardia sp. TaxID=60912 RepID=UPI002C260240|nr:TIGR02611 family protein [Pseudonocardia sp.]HTF50226.1 TIGR02611 family protein [Pseudonocardia sp.]